MSAVGVLVDFVPKAPSTLPVVRRVMQRGCAVCIYSKLKSMQLYEKHAIRKASAKGRESCSKKEEGRVREE